MNLSGFHILLTYKCNYECDHCFVWGSPWQHGTFSRSDLENVLSQAHGVDGIEEVYFEGGEAFLYYPLLRFGIEIASGFGSRVGVVSNGYWAVSEQDARLWLEPLVEVGLDVIEISSDVYHGDSVDFPQAQIVSVVAQDLGLEAAKITVEESKGPRDPLSWEPGLPLIGGGVMFRGRASEALTSGLPRQHWLSFTNCPYENLSNPGRIHLDPLGNLHICQGIVIGNIFDRSLKTILEEYNPQSHPIVGPILAGGPTQLIYQYLDRHHSSYVDACHACYETRLALREKFPAILGPDQMYGAYAG